MIKKIITLLLLVTTFSFAIHAQEKGKSSPEIRKLKLEYVPDKMSLSQNQRQRFIPLYNKYCDDIWAQKRALKVLCKNPNSMYVINERQRIEEKMVGIKGRYKNEFLKIISAQQLAAMYKAEDDFKAVLIEHLRNQHKASR